MHLVNIYFKLILGIKKPQLYLGIWGGTSYSQGFGVENYLLGIIFGILICSSRSIRLPGS